MSMLTISDVNKIYPNGKQAVFDASIDINSGEFVVFVGPSGCGKSTLLRMVAGLEEISSGEMMLGEKRLNDLEPAMRDIAMVFQNYALYPHMTVYKNLAYGLINRKTPKNDIDQRVRETAKMLQLEEYLDRKPRELSGGQRQRVAMGRAIVREPKLFLFDEPLSNLDAKLRNTMRLEIKALQRRLNTTAIYVTHDQVEAMTMADKIVILNAGRVEQVGTPKALYHEPANLFVATFIGSPAMNILDGHQRSDGSMQLGQGQNGETPIKIGIRPETISVHETQTAKAKPVKFDIVEDLGAQRVLHGVVEDQPIVIVTERHDIIADKVYFIDLSASPTTWFDTETGKRIIPT